MKKKTLQKKSRLELLELLLESREENQKLRKENEELKAQLESRQLEQADCQSLSEASLRLSGVFRAADEAVTIYLDNIRQRNIDYERKAQEEDTDV